MTSRMAASEAKRTAPAGAGSGAPTATVGTARTMGSQLRGAGIHRQRHEPVDTLVGQALGQRDLGVGVAARVGEQHVASVAPEAALQLCGELLVPEVLEAPADHADEAGRAHAQGPRDRIGAEADPRRLGANAGLGLGRHTLAAERVRHAGGREPGRGRDVAERRALASGRAVRHNAVNRFTNTREPQMDAAMEPALADWFGERLPRSGTLDPSGLLAVAEELAARADLWGDLVQPRRRPPGLRLHPPRRRGRRLAHLLERRAGDRPP